MSIIQLNIDKYEYAKQIKVLVAWNETLKYVNKKYVDIDNDEQIEAVNKRIAELELLMVIHPDG